MPSMPPKHGAKKRSKRILRQARQRQAVRLYPTNSKRWMADRERQLQKQPLCEHCLVRGVIKEANEVDHIDGSASEERDYVDSNYQSLCKPCHSRKTRSEQ